MSPALRSEWFRVLFLAAATLAMAQAADTPLPRVEFNRDIRPILADNCFQCHGPDKNKRKAELRLDSEDDVFRAREDAAIIVRGVPSESDLFRRITAANPQQKMPPPNTGRKLTDKQIALLRRWITEGATWQKHWSFVPPRRPPLPTVKQQLWPRNAIDSFVLDRLEREGLGPSPAADKAALIRRVTLDLTGLPPTLAEVDAFLTDTSPIAYEKVVDRLLSSPRLGERLAAGWLDAARYADTNGYQTDAERFMWRWRDWVIEAFNRNLAFDQFTIEQLAGDMLPNPTLDQIIATGFNRNHRGNAEGGVIPEEYAVEYVVDRVETTATVWLGLTLGCTRCHDHKFDPFTQKEFYQLFAYFNNVPERGKAIKYGNSPPFIKAPTVWQQQQLQELDGQIQSAKRAFEKLQPDLEASQTAWVRSPAVRTENDWSITKGMIVHYPFDSGVGDHIDSGRQSAIKDGDVRLVPGRVGQAARFDGRQHIDAGDVANFGFYDKFSWSAWIHPRGSKGGIILSRMSNAARTEEGYSLQLADSKLQVNLVKRWLDDALRVETEKDLAPNRWHHVVVTYDGSRVASGLRLYVDGRLEKLKINLDDLNQSFQTKQPLRIGAGGAPEGNFHGDIDDVRIFDRVVSPVEADILATPDTVDSIYSTPIDRRSEAQAQKLRAYFLDRDAPNRIRDAQRTLVQLTEKRERLLDSFPTTMIMQEMPQPRDTHVLIRGVYDKPGEKVTPGVPATFTPLPPKSRNDRLGFARWLAAPDNPLTARVAVNRFWQHSFGTGLVKTAEDFGTQGEWPSHPELLDWLATEFMEQGWNLKALLKQIVTSATYCQSSRVTPELLQRDPENRLLARGPRLRYSAEMVRDQALAVSGLLVERLGGPSVKPYQAADSWKVLADSANVSYVQDKGPSLYRRSLYTFWKRTVAPPEMMLFDAAGRETCTVRRSSTNTPLQALTLMNDVTYLEAARVLAERMIAEGGKMPEERLTFAFRLVTARQPRSAELTVLLQALDKQRVRYGQDADAAAKLVSAGESPRKRDLDVRELAAYTVVASLILNLDEAITKE